MSTAGRPPSGRLNIARKPPPKPGMPRPKKRAASGPTPRLRSLRLRNLRRRVVTQQKLFFRSVMQAAGLPRTPRELAPNLGTLLLRRLPAGRSQCPGSGTQVALSWHLGWADEARHRIPSRTPAPWSSPRTRLPSGTVAATSGVTGFSRPRRSSIIASPSSALVCWSL